MGMSAKEWAEQRSAVRKPIPPGSLDDPTAVASAIRPTRQRAHSRTRACEARPRRAPGVPSSSPPTPMAPSLPLPSPSSPSPHASLVPSARRTPNSSAPRSPLLSRGAPWAPSRLAVSVSRPAEWSAPWPGQVPPARAPDLKQQSASEQSARLRLTSGLHVSLGPIQPSLIVTVYDQLYSISHRYSYITYSSVLSVPFGLAVARPSFFEAVDAPRGMAHSSLDAALGNKGR